MPRNQAFHAREPFQSLKALELQRDRISGPLTFLNPTCACFKHNVSEEKGFNRHVDHTSRNKSPKREEEQSAANVEIKWRSRDNRKGRHALVVDPSSDPFATYLTPNTSSTLRETARGTLRMCTQFPYWDISYLIAVIFTLGSCVWVINAFFVWLPLVQPDTEFPNEILVGGGVTAFLGATIFEIGSILLMFEAVNENREGCFGWALERVFSGGNPEDRFRIRPNNDRCIHHHTNRKNLAGKGSGTPLSRIPDRPPLTVHSSGNDIEFIKPR